MHASTDPLAPVSTSRSGAWLCSSKASNGFPEHRWVRLVPGFTIPAVGTAASWPLVLCSEAKRANLAGLSRAGEEQLQPGSHLEVCGATAIHGTFLQCRTMGSLRRGLSRSHPRGCQSCRVTHWYSEHVAGRLPYHLRSPLQRCLVRTMPASGHLSRPVCPAWLWRTCRCCLWCLTLSDKWQALGVSWSPVLYFTPTHALRDSFGREVGDQLGAGSERGLVSAGLECDGNGQVREKAPEQLRLKAGAGAGRASRQGQKPMGAVLQKKPALA